MSLKDLSAILRVLSLVMLLPLAVTIYDVWGLGLSAVASRSWAFIVPSFILYVLHRLFRVLGFSAVPNTKNIMMTVVLAWTIIALVGALPFLIRGAFGPVDSFFESMSGWTTSSFSMIREYGGFDRDLLAYRGISQAMGGLGMISLGMMVMLQGSSLAIGYSDIGIHKIKPGIRQTIVESWKIYALYMLFGVVMLYIAGMGLFDAFNYGVAAVSTGGLGTHSSVAYFDSLPIEAVLVVLMLLGMTSYVIHYHLFNGGYSALKSEEVKYFAAILVFSIIAVMASVWGKEVAGLDTESVLDVGRKTVFLVVSGMSTCGFSTMDFGQWPDFAKIWMIGLMYVGGMSSSTAGGIKVIRFIVMLKAVHYSLKKLILPKSAILLIRVDHKILRDDIITIIGYSAVYLFIVMGMSMALMFLGYAGIESISTMMTAMGNGGMTVISGDAWYNMPDAGKLNIILAMWVGRIEIYPGLLLLKSLVDKFT
ncbi:MAG: potassium transporter TrkG [Candidatus Altiarchaeota archaeon]